MNQDKHLYMVIHPNHALIASQMDPAQFAKHYTQGFHPLLRRSP
jgi:hypothetical protein